ncbi:CdiA family toxin C-terminal domain-containing protein [Amphritea pacifica]|uniref:EndoU domain-containing protein n=1 Tax=Amphritea pacifica TaxID=2811233 RepID=A0ABS2WD14_9GAMM|nr:EndoU domain-containing protein [Amphritea pacifica]
MVLRDFDVPRKRGIGGAHNRDEFFKYSNEFKVEEVVSHPTLDGVETIRYRMSALDRAGNPTGEYRAAVLEKTVYDPSKISNEQFMDWGRQAAAEAQAAGRLNREWVGAAPNGLEFRGYLDETGAVKSFFPNF